MRKKEYKYLHKLIYALLIICLLTANVYFASAAVNIPKSSRQTIHGQILDSKGDPLQAQIQVWYDPLKDLVLSFDPQNKEGRTDNLIGIVYSNENGFYNIEVPADTLLLIITHGPEWELFKKRFIVDQNQFDGLEFNVTLKRLYDLTHEGWYGGDTHSHTLHSDGYQYPRILADAMQAVGLSWGILTDHNSISGAKEWLSAKSDGFVPVIGNEISTEASETAAENGYGHMNQTFIHTLNGTAPTDANIWARAVFNDHSDVQQMIDLTHQQNGVFTINHPFQSWDWAGRFKSWGKVRNFDAIEIWNGDPPHSLTTSTWDTARVNINTCAEQAWFEFLNAGNRMTGLAGSDAHDVTGGQAYPKGKFYWTTTPGNPRTYAYCKQLNPENLEKSIKNGQLFLTSGFGPLLLIKVNKKIPGQIVHIKKGETIRLTCKVLANQPLLRTDDGVRVIVNGKIVDKLATKSSMTFDKEVPLKIMGDSWVVVEVFGKWPMYAISNAVYLDFPPYGDWEDSKWQDPSSAKEWNIFRGHPQITIPDGPSSWTDSAP